ncbi:MAG TPA: TetR/AcrR family transcriptional regulator [Lachnospiraceae bacterium]|nr:TetR/AcrR family transcriptional regulator [Lachnospiraceae bacterium]
MVYIRSDKTEQRKDEKKRLIFEKAASVFAEKGYYETSIKDIAVAANISVGTIYRYFESKDILFEKLYDEVSQINRKAKNYAASKPTSSVAERFAYILSASIWVYQSFRTLAKILLLDAIGVNPDFEQKYTSILVESCEELEATLKYLKEIGAIDVPDVKVAAIMIEGAFNYSITYWLRTNESADLRDFTYPIIVASLQSLKIQFSQADIERCIMEIYQELDSNAEELLKF